MEIQLQKRAGYHCVRGNGPTLMSVIPTMCRKEFREVVVGGAGGSGEGRGLRLTDVAKTESIEEKDIKSFPRAHFPLAFLEL